MHTSIYLVGIVDISHMENVDVVHPYDRAQHNAALNLSIAYSTQYFVSIISSLSMPNLLLS